MAGGGDRRGGSRADLEVGHGRRHRTRSRRITTMRDLVPAPVSVEPAEGVTFALTDATAIAAGRRHRRRSPGRRVPGRPAAARPVRAAASRRPIARPAASRCCSPAAERADGSAPRATSSTCAADGVMIRARRPAGLFAACRRCASSCRRRSRRRSARPVDRARRADRRPPAVRLPRRRCSTSPGTSSPWPTVKRLHRPARPVQGQLPAPAPHRRPGLADRDRQLAAAGHVRRQHRGRRRARRLLHQGRLPARSSPTPPRRLHHGRARDRPARAHQRRAGLVRRAELRRRRAAALHRHRGRLQLAVRRPRRSPTRSSTRSSASWPR